MNTSFSLSLHMRQYAYCHCERSEAISWFVVEIASSLALLAMAGNRAYALTEKVVL
jgi:hypothetical protein